MLGKPATFEGYSGEHLGLVRSVCLYAATVLGDLQAVAIIRQGFATHDGLGPRRVANFLTNGPDDDIQADVVGNALAFLQEIS